MLKRQILICCLLCDFKGVTPNETQRKAASRSRRGYDLSDDQRTVAGNAQFAEWQAHQCSV
jgi:hypothetical protein